MSKLILVLGVLISLAIRIFFIAQSKHTADIYLMYNMGVAFLAGHNPYLTLDFNSYPPLAIFLEVAAIQISSFLHTSFVTIFKLFPNLADFLCGLLIYQFLIKKKVSSFKATLWTVFYLLNPISIVISSAHGQLEGITSFFVVLAIFILEFSKTKSSSYFAALSLGLAIAVKPNPIMLIPFFLLFKKSSIKDKIIFFILTLTPIILSLMPFVWQQPGQILTRLFGYSGVSDISYAAVLRSIWYQINAQTNLPLNQELLVASKYIFGAGLFVLILIFTGSRNLVKACLAAYLLFISFYFGIGSQYLVWVIPLAILERDKRIFYYTFFASLALLGFYLFFGPDILLGKLFNLEPFQTKYIYLYFLGNLLLWLFSLYWLIKIVKENVKQQSFVYFSIILFFLSFLPMIYLIKHLLDLFVQQV